MISEKEITKGKEVPEELKVNLKTLLERVNKLRTIYGKPLIVSSGWRTIEQHIAIYAKKGITDESKIPMKSHHLFCEAVDFSDPNQELQKWCLDNVKVLEEIGLWCEDFSYTKNWTHMQIIEPKSKKRFFIP